MAYRPYKPEQEFDLKCAGQHLREALRAAINADCPGLTRKIRSARKSLDGARRHLRHRKLHHTGNV